MARIQCECIAESTNEFDTAKRGHVKEQVLALIDRSPDQPRIKHAFEYVLKDGEAALYSGRAVDKRLVVAFSSFGESPMGVPRIAGEIIEFDGKLSNGKPADVKPAGQK